MARTGSALAVLITAVLLALLGVGFLLLDSEEDTRQVRFVNNGTVVATVTVDVADTPEARRQGLMNRSDLPQNHGMLFVYPDTAPRTFWMKDTHVPLDIIFLDAQKQVINIEQADPEPGTPDANLTRYRSDMPARYVIELRQGFADQHAIRPGTHARFETE